MVWDPIQAHLPVLQLHFTDFQWKKSCLVVGKQCAVSESKIVMLFVSGIEQQVGLFKGGGRFIATAAPPFLTGSCVSTILIQGCSRRFLVAPPLLIFMVAPVHTHPWDQLSNQLLLGDIKVNFWGDRKFIVNQVHSHQGLVTVLTGDPYASGDQCSTENTPGTHRAPPRG